MTNQEQPESILDSLREALEASQTAMRILQAADDQAGAIKAARACADIGARIGSLEGSRAVTDPTRGVNEKRAFFETLIKALEEKSEKEREGFADSLRCALSKLPEVGKDLPS